MASSVIITEMSKVLLPDHMQFSDVHMLSNLDQMFCSPELYPQLVFYFRSQHTSSCDTTSLMRSLKESLAMVLQEYPLVAGHARMNKQGRLELVKEPGDGVEFLEATTDARLDDWPDLRRCSLLLQLNPQDTTTGREISEVPLAKVQATVFKCGAVALGFSFAHILTDGMGAIQFLKAWSEVHQRLHLSITPVLSRTLIKARDPPHLTVPITEATSSFMLPLKLTQASIACDSSPSKALAHAILMRRLSEQKVNECVKEVEGGPFAYGSATTHEAVCALLWSSLTRARKWSTDGEDSKFSFPVNIRSRCDPPIPVGYFGNAILQCLVVGKACEIGSRHISYAAKLIHDSIQSHNAEFCQSAIDWTELQLRDGKSLRVHLGDPQVFGCTTFSGFPVYEVNFGWGKPAYVSFVQRLTESGEGSDSGVLIMPSPDGGRSRDLLMGCNNQQRMDALLNDPLFQKYRDPENDILITIPR